MLQRYFDYIFVHLRQKVRLRPDFKPGIFVNFRPEPGRNPNPTRKARPNLQLWKELSTAIFDSSIYHLSRSLVSADAGNSRD